MGDLVESEGRPGLGVAGGPTISWRRRSPRPRGSTRPRSTTSRTRRRGTAPSSILGGHVSAGISGYEEFAPQIAAGKRGRSPSPPPSGCRVRLPTFKEQGVDVSLVNWRGCSRRPRSASNDKAALFARSPRWSRGPSGRHTSRKRGWVNLYQPWTSSRPSSPRIAPGARSKGSSGTSGREVSCAQAWLQPTGAMPPRNRRRGLGCEDLRARITFATGTTCRGDRLALGT